MRFYRRHRDIIEGLGMIAAVAAFASVCTGVSMAWMLMTWGAL